MRRTILLVIFVIGTFPTSAINGSSSFDLTIQVEQPSVSAGEKIELKIILTNTSEQDLIIHQTMRPDQAEWDYDIEIKDANGQAVDETNYGKRRTQLVKFLSQKMRTVKPGQTLTGEIVLSKLFDLTVPGQYTARVSRHVGDRDSGQLVWSNGATVRVTSF